MDGEFMSIVFFSGRVKVIKMPDILDPISSTSSNGQDDKPAEGQNLLTPVSQEEKPVQISVNLEDINHQDIVLAEV